MDSKLRVIKKYPNRRLYDTATSLYITLDEVRKLVVDRASFTVVDQRTGEDITRAILLQVISEMEDHDNPVFSVEVLQGIIRMHGKSRQTSLTSFLENSLALFVEHQHMLFHEQVEKPILETPITLTQLADHNFSLWKRWQESLLSPLGGGSAGGERDPAPKT